jgi:hypothetical protein
VTRECDVWHHREQLQAPEGSHFRLLRSPIQVPRVPIQVLEKRRGWRMVVAGEWQALEKERGWRRKGC